MFCGFAASHSGEVLPRRRWSPLAPRLCRHLLRRLNLRHSLRDSLIRRPERQSLRQSLSAMRMGKAQTLKSLYQNAL